MNDTLDKVMREIYDEYIRQNPEAAEDHYETVSEEQIRVKFYAYKYENFNMSKLGAAVRTVLSRMPVESLNGLVAEMD